VQRSRRRQPVAPGPNLRCSSSLVAETYTSTSAAPAEGKSRAPRPSNDLCIRRLGLQRKVPGAVDRLGDPVAGTMGVPYAERRLIL
jgi:hypothetical protein